MPQIPDSKNSLKSAIEKRWRTLQDEKQRKDWWAPVWRGLVLGGKHYRAMKSSVWLFLYLIVHADRRTGHLFRITRRIAFDMAVSERTVKRWLKTLRQFDYIQTERTGRSLKINVMRWKPIQKPKKPP